MLGYCCQNLPAPLRRGHGAESGIVKVSERGDSVSETDGDLSFTEYCCDPSYDHQIGTMHGVDISSKVEQNKIQYQIIC